MYSKSFIELLTVYQFVLNQTLIVAVLRTDNAEHAEGATTMPLLKETVSPDNRDGDHFVDETKGDHSIKPTSLAVMVSEVVPVLFQNASKITESMGTIA